MAFSLDGLAACQTHYIGPPLSPTQLTNQSVFIAGEVLEGVPEGSSQDLLDVSHNKDRKGNMKLMSARIRAKQCTTVGRYNVKC